MEATKIEANVASQKKRWAAILSGKAWTGRKVIVSALIVLSDKDEGSILASVYAGYSHFRAFRQPLNGLSQGHHLWDNRQTVYCSAYNSSFCLLRSPALYALQSFERPAVMLPTLIDVR